MRNAVGLTGPQIQECQDFWSVLLSGSGYSFLLDISCASSNGSETLAMCGKGYVMLGANILPGANPQTMRDRLTLQASLAHEFAHLDRHELGVVRSASGPEYDLEEGEASAHASTYSILEQSDKCDLVFDASECFREWCHKNCQED